jgi:hypothetical protein
MINNINIVINNVNTDDPYLLNHIYTPLLKLYLLLESNKKPFNCDDYKCENYQIDKEYCHKLYNFLLENYSCIATKIYNIKNFWDHFKISSTAIILNNYDAYEIIINFLKEYEPISISSFTDEPPKVGRSLQDEPPKVGRSLQDEPTGISSFKDELRRKLSKDVELYNRLSKEYDSHEVGRSSFDYENTNFQIHYMYHQYCDVGILYQIDIKFNITKKERLGILKYAMNYTDCIIKDNLNYFIYFFKNIDIKKIINDLYKFHHTKINEYIMLFEMIMNDQHHKEDRFSKYEDYSLLFIKIAIDLILDEKYDIAKHFITKMSQYIDRETHLKTIREINIELCYFDALYSSQNEEEYSFYLEIIMSLSIITTL